MKLFSDPPVWVATIFGLAVAWIYVGVRGDIPPLWKLGLMGAAACGLLWVGGHPPTGPRQVDEYWKRKR